MFYSPKDVPITKLTLHNSKFWGSQPEPLCWEEGTFTSQNFKICGDMTRYARLADFFAKWDEPTTLQKLLEFEGCWLILVPGLPLWLLKLEHDKSLWRTARKYDLVKQLMSLVYILVFMSLVPSHCTRIVAVGCDWSSYSKNGKFQHEIQVISFFDGWSQT